LRRMKGTLHLIKRRPMARRLQATFDYDRVALCSDRQHATRPSNRLQHPVPLHTQMRED
jgi:hypothetical protein